jgi:hypothetical protein
MIERENKAFVTPGSHTVVLRTYLSGREARILNEIMYEILKINPADPSGNKAASLSEIPMAFMIPQQQKMLEFLVVSVDGKTENPVSLLEELPESEYNAVLAECTRIRVPLVPAK